MPELTVHRRNTAPPPMVCMYCGAPATSTTEWREANRRPEASSAVGLVGIPLLGPVALLIAAVVISRLTGKPIRWN